MEKVSKLPNDFVSHLGKKWSKADIDAYNSTVNSINIYQLEGNVVPETLVELCDRLIQKYSKV